MEHLTTNQDNRQQVSNMSYMIEYKKSIPERQGLSAVNMGRCLSHCERLHGLIVYAVERWVIQATGGLLTGWFANLSNL